MTAACRHLAAVVLSLALGADPAGSGAGANALGDPALVLEVTDG